MGGNERKGRSIGRFSSRGEGEGGVLVWGLGLGFRV